MTSIPCLIENRHDRTLRKTMDMLSGIKSVSNGHQTDECSHQAWTEARKISVKELGDLINVSGMKKDSHICSATAISELLFDGPLVRSLLVFFE